MKESTISRRQFAQGAVIQLTADSHFHDRHADLIHRLRQADRVIGISAVMPPGLTSAMLAITLVGWAGFARLVRSITLSLKEQTFIEASRAIGASSARILFRHILPNAIPLLLVAGSLRVGGFILLEATLSFLGLGVQPPTPTWGSMISNNRVYINSAPWMVIFPGLAISITVISFNLLGDFLRDKLDPRLQV